MAQIWTVRRRLASVRVPTPWRRADGYLAPRWPGIGKRGCVILSRQAKDDNKAQDDNRLTGPQPSATAGRCGQPERRFPIPDSR
jgi:hypothetical protein